MELTRIMNEAIARGLTEGMARVAQAQQQQQPQPTQPQSAPRSDGDRRTLDEKNFKRLDTFNGGYPAVHLPAVRRQQRLQETKDKVIALANNKTTMQQGPTPMDIGMIDQQEPQDHDHDHHDIDYASGGIICRKCGGMGHIARVRPSGGGGSAGGKGEGRI